MANYALSFDSASSEYVDVGAVPNIRAATTNFSIQFWVKNVSEGGARNIWANLGPAINSNGMWSIEWIDNWGGFIGMNFPNNSKYAYVLYDLTASSDWYHITYVYDGTQGTDATRLKTYVNGELVSYAGGSGVPTSITQSASDNLTLAVGWDSGVSSTYYYTGALDEFRIWDKSLSAEEVAANYDGKSVGNETNLQALYHMDEGTGTAVDDSTSNSYDGTTQNSPTWIDGYPFPNGGDGSVPVSAKAGIFC